MLRTFWIGFLALAWWCAACDNRLGPGDSGIVDAADAGGDDDAQADGGDLLADGDGPGDDGGPPAWRLGSEDTFEIATWNIRNFPTNADTPWRVAALIDGLDVDLVAVEEIADVDAFEFVVEQLDNRASVLSPDVYQPGEYQKTGFIYRSDIIQVREVASIFQADNYAFPRPPLQVEFYVHRPDGTQLTLIAIVVHLKASLGEDNEARRRDACVKLKAHVDNLVSSGTETEVVILGDFNDSLDDPAYDNVFSAFTEDPDHYRFATQPLVGRTHSYIPARVLIDHMLITADLFDLFAAGQVDAVRFDDLIQDYDYTVQVSDHRPVAAVLPW